MRLDSVRELKGTLYDSVVAPMATSFVVRSAGLRAQPTTGLAATPPTIALGVTPGKRKNEFTLAVRVQKRGLENSPQLETIRKRAKNEVDVRYVGLITKRASAPWYQKAARPLKIGASVGHFQITAGTIGGFVRGRGDGPVLILSNNHVLANENRGKKGDPVLQPGGFDGGQNPADKVGELYRFVRLKKTGTNVGDCAVAAIDDGVEYEPQALTGLGRLAGLGDIALSDHSEVRKIGRTTGATRGRVTAFEMSGVMVEFSVGLIRFDDQIEIEGEGESFSHGGDSGSMILDAELRGVGLLFAGSDQGGSNGKGLTYANPLRSVLDALKVDLVV